MAFKSIRYGVVAALCPSLLMAATLTVTVKDPGNAVVADAVVLVKPSATDALPEKKTDNQGRAVFDSLSAGSYLVSVSKSGFDTYKGEIPIGTQPVSLPVSLKLSTLSTSVKVTGRRSPLANSDPNYIALRNSKLTQSYRVENFTLTRDAGVFTFRSGSFSFGPTVLNHVTMAAFVGDGSFHLKPAFDLAATHLYKMMGAEEVNEDFTAVVLYFTDSTYEEILKNSRQDDGPTTRQEQAFEHVNKILQTRRVQGNPIVPGPMMGAVGGGFTPLAVSHQLTQLEILLNYQDIPNYDAEVLAEVYNGEKGSFRAFIRGKKHEDLRFILNPRGALPILHAPEEVALLNFAPTSNALPTWDSDGLWYLSHTLADLQSGRDGAKEEKRLIAPEHYRIDSFIGRENPFGNRPDIQVQCSMKFHSLREGVRMVKFDLVPDLQIQRVTFDGVEIPFVQESRGHDGSFYLQAPQALVPGRTYDVTFEYSGGEILQSDVLSGVPLRRTWYPMPSGAESRATYDLTFHIPKTSKIVAVGRLASQSREEGYDVTEWVTDSPIAQAIFRLPDMDQDPVSESATDDATKTPMTVYEHFSPPNRLTSFTPSTKAILSSTGQLLHLYSDWFAPSSYDHMSVVLGNYMDSLPGLVFTTSGALAGWAGLETLKVNIAMRAPIDEAYPSQIAREWWGNEISPATFHDAWLPAGLANFSASLFDTAADNDEYSDHWSNTREALLLSGRWGVINPAGPVWMGMMNDTPLQPSASSALNAAKGGFIIQMLRGMMWDPQTGDADFRAMLRDFVAQFANRAVSSDDFQTLVEKHMKGFMDMNGDGRMNWFFREWLYTTDVPAYRLEYSLKPGDHGNTILDGKLTQSGVSPTFQMLVPIFGEYAGKMARIGVAAMRGNDTREFRVSLSAPPKKVILNLNHDILTTKDEVVAMK